MNGSASDDRTAAPLETAGWVLIVGEYPPQAGGVADYTYQLAEALAAAGDSVDVYAPPAAVNGTESAVRIHRLRDRFGVLSLLELFTLLRTLPKQRRVLVQYVPQSFGMRALNFPLICLLYLMRRVSIWVMFHEFAIKDDATESLAKRVQAFGTRLMSSIMAKAANRAFVSTPAWEFLVRGSASHHRTVSWLPVPSNLPTTFAPGFLPADVRTQLNIPEGVQIVGHFGTYSMIRTCRMLHQIIPTILDEDSSRRFLLIGRNGKTFAAALIQHHPQLASRLIVTGGLAPERLAAHLGACDVLVQPYSEGVTTRRGSLIAGLALGVPIVTTVGASSETLWHSSEAVVLAPDDAPHISAATETLLSDADMRDRLRSKARELYESRFDLRHTIRALREANQYATTSGSKSVLN